MTIVIVSVGLVTIAFLLLVAVGIRSRMIFVNPSALSDAQVDAAVQITNKIMARSKAGSPTWTRAAAKHKAAVDEQLRRSGGRPLDDIELVEADPDAR